MNRQQTIKRAVTIEGVGLHTGQVVSLKLRPAPPDSGVVFHHMKHESVIPARSEFVVDSHYATTLGVNGSRIHTVEHLLAAAAGLGVDNLTIEVDGDEVPAMDGSAKEFVAAIERAGRVAQSASRRSAIIPEPIRVGTETRWIEILPSNTFRISYTLDVDHPLVGTQSVSVPFNEEIFVSQFAGARTYGFLRDVPLLWKRGLAQGGTLENAVIIGKRKILNGGLRFDDEFVRHKVLDLVGDLSLLGRPLVGHVVARNAGHAINNELVLAIHAALERASRSDARAEVSQPAVSEGAFRRALAPIPGAATV